MARGGPRSGGGSRNPANQPRSVQVSRKVSWLLRHGAGAEGLTLGKGGYVSVAAALETRALRSLQVTFEELREVVRSSDKQRFSMVRVGGVEGGMERKDGEGEGDGGEKGDEKEKEKGDEKAQGERQGQEQENPHQESNNPADYLIRANQGHSIKIDTDGLLIPLTLEATNLPTTVVHGTDDRAWPLILKGGGLHRMTRTHIHFASGLPAGFTPLTTTTSSSSSEPAESAEPAPPVISGMRTSSTVLIYIDIRAALAAGIPFFVSENGVILSEGNAEGVLPFDFFSRVERRRKDGGDVLMSGGKLPEGVVVDVAGWEKEMRSFGGKRGGRGGRGGGKARANDDSRDLLAGAE